MWVSLPAVLFQRMVWELGDTAPGPYQLDAFEVLTGFGVPVVLAQKTTLRSMPRAWPAHVLA